MNIRFFTKAAAAIALGIFALAACKKDPKNPNDPGHNGHQQEQPTEQVTEGLSVQATYRGDYYGKGFLDYVLIFQTGEVGEDGYFKNGGIELSLDVLTSAKEGDRTVFPAGVYELTDTLYKSAGIIPTIEGVDEKGKACVIGDTYLYTETDADNYWNEPLEFASLDVAKNGAQYTIKVSFKVDGEDYSYLYKGALSIEDMSKSDDPGNEDGPEGDYDFKADDVIAFNLGHAWESETDTDDWMIYLNNAKDEDEYILIEIVSETGENPEALPEGTFVVPADFYDEEYAITAGIMCPIYNIGDEDDPFYYGTYYAFGGDIWYAATSGNVKITRSGDEYTIAVSFRDEDYDNAKVTSTFTGKVEVDVSEYYDGAPASGRFARMLPSLRKVAAKKAHKQCQVRSASRLARR